MFLRCHWLFLTTLVVMATACNVFTTFNAALTGVIPNASDQKDAIVAALKTSSADFICLQEVWNEDDMTVLLQRLRFAYPHHYSKLHVTTDSLRPPVSCVDQLAEPHRQKDTPCSFLESSILQVEVLTCAVQNGCNNLPRIEQGVCINHRCSHVYNSDAISTDCVSCVIFNFVFFPTLGGALQECTLPKTIDNRLNGPGLLVLSKAPFARASYTPFFPDSKLVLEKGYIKAEFYNGTRVVCAHLSSLYPVYAEYNTTFTNYLDQQHAEISKLLEKEWTPDSILMGDFNTGPKVIDGSHAEKNLAGEGPANYQYLIDAGGFQSPYMSQDGRCTWCVDNPLIDHPLNAPFRKNNAIDHVLLTDHSNFYSPRAERVFDQVSPPMSDHYGVQVTLCEK